MRRKKKRLDSFGFLFFLVTLPAYGGEAEEGKARWRSLLQNQGLSTWRALGDPGAFSVQDTTIVGTAPRGKASSLLSKECFGNFELRFEVARGTPLRSAVEARRSTSSRKGGLRAYAVITTPEEHAGCISGGLRHGLISHPRTGSRVREAAMGQQWNRFRILCVGDTIRTWVNGIPVAHTVDRLPRSGPLCFRIDPPEGEEARAVKWRNVRIREVNDPASPVIAKVEKECLRRTIYMIGPQKAKYLAGLIHSTSPRVVVECGTAIGYSGLWILRELEAQGSGKLITIELNPDRARRAQRHFNEAGLGDLVEVKVGDAREVVKEIGDAVDFAFIDCGYGNYFPCLKGLEGKLRSGATVVADNVGIGASGMKDYLEYVRRRYASRTQWFDTSLPWSPRDAMEITTITK